MTGLSALKDKQTTQLTGTSSSSWIKTLCVILFSIIAVLLLQGWSASGVVNSTTDLRAVLSEVQHSANELERRIGYGGLIHNFKNYVLRPAEDIYRTAALADAEAALSLLENIQENATEVGIHAPLENTLQMLNSYAQRLEQVRELSHKGLTPQSIDKLVRFDDKPALLEVEAILGELDKVVDERLAELQKRGLLTSLLSTASTAALGLLIVGIVAQRQLRHTDALRVLAQRLTASNEDLSTANTSLSQFAGVVSHDLKTPIRYIHTYNRMIVDDMADPAAVEEHVDIIESQVQQMDAIIDSLLDFTKFGFSKPQYRDIDISSLFSDLERDLLTEVDHRNVSVEFKVQHEMPVRLDPVLFKRVFANLVDNSFKYACDDKPACITVRADTDGERALFSVTDNGIGIDERFATNIFEPMARLHGPQSKYKGVGIGLSLAKSIVESHEGLIWLDTEFKQGTRIAFSLPLAHCAKLKAAA